MKTTRSFVIFGLILAAVIGAYVLWPFDSSKGTGTATSSGVSLAPAVVAFGTITGEKVLTRDIAITVPGMAALSLGRMTSSWPCIRLMSAKTDFAAGEKPVVTVQFEPKGLQPGKDEFPFSIDVLAPVKTTLEGTITFDMTAAPAAPETKPCAPGACPVAKATKSPTDSTAPRDDSTDDDAEEAKPVLTYGLSPATHDFGKVFEGEVRTTTLAITRPEGTALQLGRLYSSCPCITVSADRTSFAANEPGAINIRIHSLTIDGDKTYPIYAEVVSPVHETLRADVKIASSRVPSKLKVSPEAVHLGMVNGPSTQTVSILNLTRHPVTMKSATCAIPGIAVALPKDTTIQPGLGGTLTVTVTDPKGQIAGAISVETSVPEHARMDIPVDGTAATQGQ